MVREVDIVVAEDELTAPLKAIAENEITVSLSDIQSFAASDMVSMPLDGDKFYSGFGDTILHYVDYWTLRARSNQLFNENIYARGLIRRILTNVINTGLHLEAMPMESILGFEEDALDSWAENVESRFELYSNDPKLCDYQRKYTFGELQSFIKLEAMLDGDQLVVLRPDKVTGIPRIQVISGSSIQTPVLSELDTDTYDVVDGVRIDKKTGEHVGFYVAQEKAGEYEYLPAYSPKSGRRIAWLVYGTDKRHKQVRGVPMLQLILQSLKEIDRHRDAIQRKAVINSILALWIEKSTNKQSTLPIQNSAVRRDVASVSDSDGKQRKFNVGKMMPGVVIDELQEGEKPHGFTGASTMEFGPFEAAMLQGIAWAYEIPPEILMLSFEANYSASQAAINEFKIFLNRERDRDGKQLCQPIYVDWLLSECLLRRVPGQDLLNAWRDPLRYDEYNAWIFSDWAGAIKPSTDIKKQAEGYRSLVNEGWITNDRATRELTGMKFRRNIQRLKKENQLKADAMRPILELQKEMSNKVDDKQTKPTTSTDPKAIEQVEKLASEVQSLADNVVHFNNEARIREAVAKRQLSIERQSDGSLLVKEL